MHFAKQQRDPGGAVYSSTFTGAPSGNGATHLADCTLSGNTAQQGGGIYNAFGHVFLDSCTITANSAPGAGGGGVVALSPDDEPPLSIIHFRNSIVAGNVGFDLRNPVGGEFSYFNPPFYSDGYNLVGEGGNPFVDFSQPGDDVPLYVFDPRVFPLAENGGPTPTHALRLGSRALDTGNTDQPADQRGVSRPFGAADDKGAFESNSVLVNSLVVTTLADEDDGTSDPAYCTGTSLREAIAYANRDGVNSAITFSPTVFAAPRKTIVLGGTQLPSIATNGTCSITAPAAGPVMSQGRAGRRRKSFRLSPSHSTPLVLGGFALSACAVSGLLHQSELLRLLGSADRRSCFRISTSKRRA